MGKKLRVLYVCPFAHYSGHHPHVATVEPEIMSNSGLDVTLLTFNGIIDNTQVRVKHNKVLYSEKHPLVHKLLKAIRQRTLPRWILMFIETSLTLGKASRLMSQGKCDVLYLRDGEPFLFLSHIVSLLHRNHKWVISLTAAIVFKPELKAISIRQQPFTWLYTLALYFVNSSIWKSLYWLSLRRNEFRYVTQNEVAAKSYREYMKGVFRDKVSCIEWGIDDNATIPTRVQARNYLKLPDNVFVMLSFGAPHSGKNMNVIFEALRECPNVFLVHGGIHTFSLGSSPVGLAEKFSLDGRVKIFNHYIPEEDKPFFFSAADVSILSYTKAFASTSSMVWESSKYRIPVISSNANTLGKDVKRYNLGLLFEAENSKSLASTIKEYQELPEEKIQEFKNNCSVFVKDHSSDRWAKEHTKLFKELIDAS